MLLGTDMAFHANPDDEAAVLAIVGNEAVISISINQDPLMVQAVRDSSVPGPQLRGQVTNADVNLVVAACDPQRPTQRWRHDGTTA